VKKVKLQTGLLLMLTLLFCAGAPASLYAAPSVYLNGQELSFDVPPTIENGRTLVPLRAIFEAMGASVSWDNDTRTATAVKGDTTVRITIGSTRPTINGVVCQLDVPAQIVNGRILAPLRFVGEAFGGSVDWDAATETISISTLPDIFIEPPGENTIIYPPGTDICIEFLP